ncbi:MAG: hypothetical protein Q9218_002901 [Villophora microphyllina]
MHSIMQYAQPPHSLSSNRIGSSSVLEPSMPFPNSTKSSVTVDELEDKERPLLGHEAAGIPRQIQRLSWLDIAAVFVVLLAAAIAIVAVWQTAIAMFLGQTNQLVVLGLTLAIMAFCTPRQIQKLTLLYEVRFGASTLQNLDAILRNDYFASAMSWQPRLILWLLLLLPLGLGAAYKKFSGGSTNLTIHGPDADFGATAAPGYQLIGDGLSLLSTVYLPYWLNPAVNRTYGFNLFIADNTSLQNDQSMTITAKVDATVTQNINPSKSERNDPEYWQTINDSYPDSGRTKLQGSVNGLHGALWAGEKTNSKGSKNNYYIRDWSVIYLSRWNTDNDESFASQAERFVATRRTCTGTWNITRTSASLISVILLEEGVKVDGNQGVIRNNDLGIGEFYTQFMAMLWSRLVSHDGPERWTDDNHHYPELAYRILSRDIRFVKNGRTLRRSSWLIVILLIHPVLTIATVLAKALLFGTPVSDDFGPVSLLAGVRESEVEKLRGAALSGRLRREMRVRFQDRGSGERDG